MINLLVTVTARTQAELGDPRARKNADSAAWAKHP